MKLNNIASECQDLLAKSNADWEESVKHRQDAEAAWQRSANQLHATMELVTSTLAGKSATNVKMDPILSPGNNNILGLTVTWNDESGIHTESIQIKDNNADS